MTMELFISQRKPLKYSKEFEVEGYKKIYKDVKIVNITDFNEYMNSDRYVIESEIVYKDKNKEVEKIIDNYTNEMEYIKYYDDQGRIIHMRNNIYGVYVDVYYTYDEDGTLIKEECKDLYTAIYIYEKDSVKKLVKNLITGKETLIEEV